MTVSDDKFGILLKLVKGDFVGLDRFVDESSKLKYKTCIPRTMLLKLNLELLSEDNFQIFFKEIALKKASIIQKIKEGKSKVKNERLKIFENHRELREISKNKTVLINKIKNFRVPIELNEEANFRKRLRSFIMKKANSQNSSFTLSAQSTKFRNNLNSAILVEDWDFKKKDEKDGFTKSLEKKWKGNVLTERNLKKWKKMKIYNNFDSGSYEMPLFSL